MKQANPFNKLNSGTEYRRVEGGFILKRGQRFIHLIAKSYNQTQKAKKIIGTLSFNYLFSKGRSIAILGSNVKYLKVKN